MTIPITDGRTRMFEIADRMLRAAIRKEDAGDIPACDMWLDKAVAKEAEAIALPVV